MDKTDPINLEALWENLLSRRPEEVRSAFITLTPKERQSVLVHLRRMVEESGWHPEQRKSAMAALEALENITK